MRVLHVIPSLSPSSGGPAFALPAMACSLVGYDTEITIATTDDDGRGKRLSGINPGTLSRIENADVRHFPKQTEFYKVSLPLRQWLRAHVHEFDLVHIHSVFSFASLAAGRAAAAQGVPYIVRPLGVLNRWGMENRRRLLKALTFRLFDLPMLKKAAAMHYTSRMELEEASRFSLANLQRVIPVGLDMTPFDAPFLDTPLKIAFPELATTQNLLFLSRIDLKKGLDLLIIAFSKLRPQYPNLHLIICGEGQAPLVDQLKTQAQTLGVADHITWTGRVDHSLKMAAFDAADLFILPSHSENFGIALLEAMAAGLPCLSTNEVALASEASKEEAVYLTERDPDSIAKSLDVLLQSPITRQHLAANAKSLARRDYSLPAMGAALNQLYQEVSHLAA